MLASLDPTASIASDVMLHAWSDYRKKQEMIVDYLLYLCDQDGELCDFVQSQAWGAIQADLGEEDTYQAQACLTAPSPWSASQNSSHLFQADLRLLDHLDPVPTVQTAQVEAEAEESSGNAMKLLARLMEDDDEKVTAEKNIELLKSMMNELDDSMPSTHKVSKRDKDVLQRCVQSDHVVPYGAASEPKTTLVINLQRRGDRFGIKFDSATSVLPHLLSVFDIAGGRDMDFLYCPVDFGRPYIKGYAILNFRDPEKAVAVEASSPEWSWARMQGLDRNTLHFLKRHSHVKSPRFRPLVWPHADVSEPTCLRTPVAQITEEEKQERIAQASK